MKLLPRIALAGIAGAAALALAGPALASFTPKLIVGHTARSAATGTVSVELGLADEDADVVAADWVAAPTTAAATPMSARQNAFIWSDGGDPSQAFGRDIGRHLVAAVELADRHVVP